jgi:Fe-S cluster assembly protein SufD
MKSAIAQRPELVERYEALARETWREGPRWLGELREAALARFLERGFPTRRDEDWKYTNLAALARLPFVPGDAAAETDATDPLAGLDAYRLVFVNGSYRPGLSTPGPVRAGSLANALTSGDGAAESHLGRYADYRANPLVALNTAFLSDGLFAHVPPGAVLDKPVYVRWISAGEVALSNPRALIVLGRGAQAAFIEAYTGAGAGPHFSNAVTELVLGEGAVASHSKLQQESAGSYHVATVQAHQERSSTLNQFSFSLGALLARNDINSVLAGEGAECVLNGLYLVSGDQFVDHHTALDHAKPHCPSREYYRGVLGGRSTGVFNGKILVRKDAQKTDAIQSNKNLLVSAEASVNTKPQLEIYADDVRCTHGATVGQLDPEALYYLRSRGIGADQARRMLTVAFTAEILDRVPSASLRGHLARIVAARLEEVS